MPNPYRTKPHSEALRDEIQWDGLGKPSAWFTYFNGKEYEEGVWVSQLDVDSGKEYAFNSGHILPTIYPWRRGDTGLFVQQGFKIPYVVIQDLEIPHRMKDVQESWKQSINYHLWVEQVGVVKPYFKRELAMIHFGLSSPATYAHLEDLKVHRFLEQKVLISVSPQVYRQECDQDVVQNFVAQPCKNEAIATIMAFSSALTHRNSLKIEHDLITGLNCIPLKYAPRKLRLLKYNILAYWNSNWCKEYFQHIYNLFDESPCHEENLRLQLQDISEEEISSQHEDDDSDSETEVFMVLFQPASGVEMDSDSSPEDDTDMDMSDDSSDT